MEEEATAVSSQGSEPSSPHQQVAEEGREAEASAPTGVARRAQTHAHSSHSPHSQNQRWMRAADSESGTRGRGMRSRGRPSRRSHNYMRF